MKAIIIDGRPCIKVEEVEYMLDIKDLERLLKEILSVLNQIYLTKFRAIRIK